MRVLRINLRQRKSIEGSFLNSIFSHTGAETLSDKIVGCTVVELPKAFNYLSSGETEVLISELIQNGKATVKDVLRDEDKYIRLHSNTCLLLTTSYSDYRKYEYPIISKFNDTFAVSTEFELSEGILELDRQSMKLDFIELKNNSSDSLSILVNNSEIKMKPYATYLVKCV